MSIIDVKNGKKNGGKKRNKGESGILAIHTIVFCKEKAQDIRIFLWRLLVVISRQGKAAVWSI